MDYCHEAAGEVVHEPDYGSEEQAEPRLCDLLGTEEEHHVLLEAAGAIVSRPAAFLVAAEAEADQVWHWTKLVAGQVHLQAGQIYQHLQLVVVLGILVEVVKALEAAEKQELQVLATLGMRLGVGAMEAVVEEDRAGHHFHRYSED